MKPSFRKRIAPLHTWSGLIVGWLLFAIAITGTASVFRGEIGDWMRPEVTATAPPGEAVDRAARDVLARYPDLAYLSLHAPHGRAATVQAVFADPDAPKGYADIALDPVTGSDAGIRETLGGEFFYRFHFELQLPYPWGRFLACAAAMLALIALVSGLVIHRRIFTDIFTLRTGKGQRSWLDAHNLLGVFAMPFHLMIAITGIVTLLTLAFPWGGSAAYGEDTAALGVDLYPQAISRAASGESAALADLAPMVAAAQARFEGGRAGRISIANPGDRAAVVTIYRHDGDQLAYSPDAISFGGATGQMLTGYREARPAKRTYDVLYGLHMGRFAPAVAHWLYFLSGLAFTALIATGLVLWTKSRSRLGGLGHAIVTRVNLGIVTGLPAGILAHFYANRLLGTGIGGRIEAEVASFFWAIGGAIVFALVRPPHKGWFEANAGLAAAAAALPIVSYAITGRGLWQGLAARDGVFVGFDAVMFAAAALFAAVAIHSRRAGYAAPASAPSAAREAIA